MVLIHRSRTQLLDKARLLRPRRRPCGLSPSRLASTCSSSSRNDPSFKAYPQGHNTAAVRLTCILCAALMPAGVTLDLLTNREKVWQFLGCAWLRLPSRF